MGIGDIGTRHGIVICLYLTCKQVSFMMWL